MGIEVMGKIGMAMKCWNVTYYYNYYYKKLSYRRETALQPV